MCVRCGDEIRTSSDPPPMNSWQTAGTLSQPPRLLRSHFSGSRTNYPMPRTDPLHTCPHTPSAKTCRLRLWTSRRSTDKAVLNLDIALRLLNRTVYPRIVDCIITRRCWSLQNSKTDDRCRHRLHRDAQMSRASNEECPVMASGFQSITRLAPVDACRASF